jgi:hypothetical protein
MSDPINAIVPVMRTMAPTRAAFTMDCANSSKPNNSSLLLLIARPTPNIIPESIIEAETTSSAKSKLTSPTIEIIMKLRLNKVSFIQKLQKNLKKDKNN